MGPQYTEKWTTIKKKNGNGIRFALPAEIGRVELVDVTDLENVLDQYALRLRSARCKLEDE